MSLNDKVPTVYLSRRNLETMLSKLDRNKQNPRNSACTLIKTDDKHPTHPQNCPAIIVKAVEDDEYYKDRRPGTIHPSDRPFVHYSG